MTLVRVAHLPHRNAKFIFSSLSFSTTTMRLELELTASAPTQIGQNVKYGLVDQEDGNFDKILADGIAAAQAGNRARARILLQHAVELDSRSESAWLWLASISEYPEELLVFLDHVLEINPQNERAAEWKTATNLLMAKTFVQRGIDASKDGRSDLAMQCFDTALTYDEQNQLAWFWKDSLSKEEVAETLDGSGLVDLVAGKRSLAAILIEAEALIADDDRQQALVLVNEAVNVDPDSEKAWTLRSQLIDDFDEKRRSLERVIEINPENGTCKAALETLFAMIETVAPNIESRTEPTAERLWNTPFDQVAQPINTHENSPTQELELPEAIKNNNPFVSNESSELSGEVWAPELEIESQLESDNRPAEDFAAIEAPYEASASLVFQQEDWDNYETRFEELENYSPMAADAGVFQESDPASPGPEVQEVSAAAYLEETEDPASLLPLDENFLNSPSWSEEDDDSEISLTDEENPIWVIDESEPFEPLEEAKDTTARTILVVDDSPVVRKLIACKLEESGYTVISAGSGAEAISAISNSIPDLVLLDIAMPQMNGYQVCENIRRNKSTKDIPVVLISGKDGYYDENLAQKAGTSSFISKPFGPETLMRAMETYLPFAEQGGN
jgi:CheY-like chemotaxis protein